MRKTYICRKYPFYAIGSSVKFRDGIYATESASEQRSIEGNDWFGVHITEIPVDVGAVADKIRKMKDRSTSEVDKVMGVFNEEVEDLFEDTEEIAVEEEAEEGPKFSATDINRMSKGELQVVALKLGISPDQSVIKLKRLIKTAVL